MVSRLSTVMKIFLGAHMKNTTLGAYVCHIKVCRGGALQQRKDESMDASDNELILSTGKTVRQVCKLEQFLPSIQSERELIDVIG